MPAGRRRRVPRWSRWLARGELGRVGEAVAARFLRKTGYRIVERNLRMTSGEIDLIVARGEVVAVVEVRTRRPQALVRPEETVDRTKQLKLLAAFVEWRRRRARRSIVRRVVRFDIVAVEIDDDWSVTRLDHLERAFEPPRDTPIRY